MALQGLSSITDWLITNNQPNNYDEVARDWLIALVVIAAAWAFVAFAFKWLIKSQAKLPKNKIWGRTKTIVYILVVTVLLGITVSIVYKSSLDFIFVVGLPGLFKGIFVGTILFIFLTLILHLFGDARRDIYY